MSLFGGASSSQSFAGPSEQQTLPYQDGANESGDTSSEDEESLPDAQPRSQTASFAKLPRNKQSDADESNQETITDNSDTSDDEAEPRPNKWTGPPRTWRRYTENERQLTSSLNQIRAGELNIHLYNAHALKARLRSAHSAADAKPWQRKDRWIDKSKDQAWVPNKIWTAWPLEPELVPRPDEEFGRVVSDEEGEEVTFRRREVWKPSRELEEVLSAIILRRAKERWEGREWENERGEGPEEERVKRESQARRRSLSSASLASGRVSTRQRSRSRSVRSVSWHSGLDAEGSVRAEDVETSTPEEQSRSRASSGRRSGSPSATHSEEEEEGSDALDSADETEQVAFSSSLGESLPKPAVMADDERAYHILQPTVRSILSKLDNLLFALHRSRQNHFNATSEDTGDEAPTGDEAVAASRPQGRKPKKRKGKKRAEAEDRSRSEASDQNDPSASPASPSTSKAPPSQQTRKRRRSSASSTSRSDRIHEPELNLRDWSEVLGTASLIGWNPRAVHRAAARCASLFGEGMAFRTLYEDSALDPVPEPVEYKPDLIPPLSALLGPGEGLDDTSVRPRAQFDPNSLVCPHVDCPKHKEPFPLPRRAWEHIRRVHKYDPFVEEPPQSGMVGGVHVDGFLQPIHAQQGWRGRDKTVSEKRKRARGKKEEGRRVRER